MPVTAWTMPKDWSQDELVTHDMLNTHLRDNLKYLKSPYFEIKTRDTSPTSFSDITTTTWTDIHSDFIFTDVPTYGGRLLVAIMANIKQSTTAYTLDFHIGININGVQQVGDQGIYRFLDDPPADGNNQVPIALMWVTDVVQGSTQTIKIQAKRGATNSNALSFYRMTVWIREV